MVFATFLTFLALFGATVCAETVTVKTLSGDSAIMLKRIVDRVGDHLRVLVVDSLGHERQIYITADDALEVKRGLWMIRPGIYLTDL